VTVVVNSVRRLYLSPQLADAFSVPSFRGQIVQSLAWLVGVLLVFVTLSVLKFRRLSD